MSKIREFDIIVFGASGFTGQFVVEELARSVTDGSIKWAIAGRSDQKLKQVLEVASNELNIDLRGVSRVEADINNDESISNMCKRAQVVINCVGPYGTFGEQVVKACVANATSHVDISGEPYYLEEMQLKYNEEAKQKGIYIVGACGWDSIPCDLGIQYLKKNFDGELNSVETFMFVKHGPQGYKGNVGTWNSAIDGYAKFGELRSLRRRLFTEVFTKRAPQPKHKLQRKLLPFRNPTGEGWCLPFPGSDRSVVQRTQRFKFEHNNERPTQIQTYFVMPSLLYMIGVLFVGAMFGVMSSFKCGRSLLLRYPRLFSFGMFAPGGPTREQIKGVKFELNLLGRGWKERLSEPTDEPTFDENKTVAVRVKGLDPGYLATSTCIVQAALTILKESDKMPKPGGVFTPGAAFDLTDIIRRLSEHQMSFEVIDS